MGKIYVTSDLHFFHKNIIKYENRRWETIEEMNQGLVDKWNAVVDNNDIVYILGDMTMSGFQQIEPILKALKGHKILIRGNHDYKWLKNERYKEYIDEVCDYKTITYNGKRIVMSHFPIACWEEESHGAIHLYGHIHSNSHELPEGFNRKQSYNVGVDTNHYRPVDLDWILNLMEMRKEPEIYIPKNTPYCYGNSDKYHQCVGSNLILKCPFWDYAENREKQNYGVCRYLDEGDFERNIKYNNNDGGCWSHSDKTTTELFGEQFPRSLIWDEVKECGINDECDF